MVKIEKVIKKEPKLTGNHPENALDSSHVMKLLEEKR